MGHLALCLLLSPMFSFGRYHPIHQGSVPITGDYTPAQIQKAITKALINRGWQVTARKSGEVLSTLFIRRHMAKIRIIYDADAVRLEYVDSFNLGYRKHERKGPLIHRNYNNWIRNLEKDIQRFLI